MGPRPAVPFSQSIHSATRPTRPQTASSLDLQHPLDMRRTDPTNSGCADSIGPILRKGLASLGLDAAKVGESAEPEDFDRQVSP